MIVIVFIVSIIAVISSSIVLLQYMQLLLSQNSYEVKTLLRIGYSPLFISRIFAQYFSVVFALSLLAAFALFFLVKWWINDILQVGGIYLDQNLSFIAVTILPVSFITFIGFGTITARKNVMKLFNK